MSGPCTLPTTTQPGTPHKPFLPVYLPSLLLCSDLSPGADTRVNEKGAPEVGFDIITRDCPAPLDVKYLGQASKASEDELEADKHEDGVMPFPRDDGSGRHANNTPVFDFSTTFDPGTPDSWRRRILTPQANSWINYKLNGDWPNIYTIKWVASRDTSASSVEDEIDTLEVGGDSAGGPRAGEQSRRQWLSRGFDATTGQHYISIQTQSWLQNTRDLPGRVGRQARNGFGEVGSDASYKGRPGDYMRLKIKWSRQEEFLREGISMSGLFTVAESPDKESIKGKWSQEAVSRFDWAQNRGTEESVPMGIPNPFGGGIATSTDTPPTPPFPSSDLFPDPLPPPSSTPPSPTVDTGPYQTDDDSADASSISTGAIAGIAAGCAIALILLFTAVWFLVARYRRRRRHRPPQQESPSNDKATALMDDRRISTTHVAQSVQSPQSPQSPNSAHLSPVVPIRPRQQNEESPRTATASFAERGMTPEERRRWEEEERQLDDEIARKNNSL
ncbi:hypothetical protein E4U34_002576 [Claviceps purpurea]|nr:hypothetical protein E4U36_000859 [Claviceps purpurea]KAG6220811.1 hypothetical protein E4U34_002576 [Claviceps purpurea]